MVLEQKSQEKEAAGQTEELTIVIQVERRHHILNKQVHGVKSEC